MDFKDHFKQLVNRVTTMKESLNTEEATKNALIMPFIQMLGYDVFNPMEVVPELDCDLINKKGDKIDYAINKDGETIILIECKHWKQDLNLHDTQLQKYFVASKSKFGILTNGVQYRFYTDLSKPNIMDDVPFLEVNMEDVKEHQIDEVKMFHKSYFDVDNIFNSASELKYMSELKNQIKEEFDTPSPEFVKMLTKRIYDGAVTSRVLDQFTDLVKRTIKNHINDVLSERLNIAFKSTEINRQKEITVTESATEAQEEEKDAPKIVTTEEELEGFYIVKSCLRNAVPAERITYQDTISYFVIRLDNKKTKIICRLYFNSSSNKQIGVFDDDGKEVKYKITSLDDIYLYQEELVKSVNRYIGASE